MSRATAQDFFALMGHQSSKFSNKLRFNWGVINSYDSAHHTVHVKLRPQNIVTADMQLMTPFAGSSYGDQIIPEVGMQVLVLIFDEGEHMVCFPAMFNDNWLPPVPNGQPGERYIRDKVGNWIKMMADGYLRLFGKNGVYIGTSTGGDPSGSGNGVVRQQDLQAVATVLNNFISYVTTQMTLQTPVGPTIVGTALPPFTSTASASSSTVVKVQ